MDISENEPIRVLIYVRVTDLPGIPQARYHAVGQIVSQQLLSRDYKPNVQAPSYDYVHTAAKFDSDKPVREYFICDFNVTCRYSKPEILLLPHYVYYLSLQKDKWIFIAKPTHIEGFKTYCVTFPWGGKGAQDIADTWRITAGDGSHQKSKDGATEMGETKGEIEQDIPEVSNHVKV